MSDNLTKQVSNPAADSAAYPNTYIGMRYVPIIVGEWDTTMQAEYEPLTIVTYQGNSYTSRTFVPKNINITNTEYWVLSANYNAQVEAYRQQVAAYKEQADNLQTDYDTLEPMVRNNTISINVLEERAKKRYIIIGDSYATNVNNLRASWVESFVYDMQISESDYIKVAQGGAGFTATPKFKDLLTQAITQATEAGFLPSQDINILVAGGFNDRNTTVSSVTPEITEFIDMARRAFPKCNIYIAFIAGTKDATYKTQLIKAYQAYLIACQQRAATFLDVYPTIPTYDFLSEKTEDLVHPGSDGMTRIAMLLHGAIEKGRASYDKKTLSATLFGKDLPATLQWDNDTFTLDIGNDLMTNYTLPESLDLVFNQNYQAGTISGLVTGEKIFLHASLFVTAQDKFQVIPGIYKLSGNRIEFQPEIYDNAYIKGITAIYIPHLTFTSLSKFI